MKSYGISGIKSSNSVEETHFENIKRKGFSIETNFIPSQICDAYIDLIKEEYRLQENEFGREGLNKINELNMARMPFLRQRELTNLFTDPFILKIVKSVIGDAIQLHLQNAIINKANEEHHQSSWHRDLPYQEWIISKPLAVNAFFCLTNFNEENGATQLIPYSHLFDKFPSIEFAETNKISVTATKGSVLFFDSMIYHKAGFNGSGNDRIGVNNMFVVPIIKPQIDVFKESHRFSTKEEEILGVKYQIPENVKQFRNKRLMK